MTVLRSERVHPFSATADPLNASLAFAVSFAEDDGAPYLGGNNPTKNGTLPLIATAYGANTGRDISNGGAGGINQYRWADATKIGIPAGVAAFTIWWRLRTPSGANSAPNQRPICRITDGTTERITLYQYELNNTFNGYGVLLQKDVSTNLVTYSDTGCVIPPNTEYDLYLCRDASGNWEVYVNPATTTPTKTGTGLTASFTATAGGSYCYFGGVNSTRNGVLIDARVWSRKLSASEILTHRTDPYSYDTNTHVSDTITLDSPADGASVSSNITISGTSNTTKQVEARFNGGAWATIATANGSTYSGVLTGQAAGTGLLEVRLVGTSVTDSALNVTVVADSISFVSPPGRKVWQMDGTGHADMSYQVAYTGTVINIEARFNGAGGSRSQQPEARKTSLSRAAPKAKGRLTFAFRIIRALLHKSQIRR